MNLNCKVYFQRKIKIGFKEKIIKRIILTIVLALIFQHWSDKNKNWFKLVEIFKETGYQS